MYPLAALAIVALAGLGFHAPVSAQVEHWPSKPIKLLLPVPPGGLGDASARLIQGPLSKALGQPVIVENRPGAAATISTEAVAHAKPDGYTLGLVYTAHAANPALLPKLPYDSARDITPIAMFWRATLGISVAQGSPYKTLDDLVQAAKARPGTITYAHSGQGQATHIAASQFERNAGIQLVSIPYKGGGPATTDVVAGHVPVLSSGTGQASNFINAGQLRLLAITSGTRSTLYPNVPTAAELGLRGVEMSEWYGFIGPAGLPEPIVRKLNAAIIQVLQLPEVKAQFAKWDMTTQAMTPAEFGKYLADETRRMDGVIKAAHIKID